MARLVILSLLVSLLSSTARADAVTDAGKVVAVTVFQGQALVTRELKLPAGEGLVEVIVTDLPEQLLPGSLYAEPGQGVEVRSVRARNRPTDEAPREEIKDLEAKLRELQRSQRALTREQQLLKQRTNYLNNLESFTSGTAKEELKHGVLNADTLTELTTLVFDRRADVADRELEVAVELEELKTQQSLAQRELQTLTGGKQRSRREAVVFLNKQKGATSVRLKYLVAGASWSPSYNVRAAEDGSDITVEYSASVTQMSGEDWSEVEMTLSTATPSLVATAPKLLPLAIRLTAPRPQSGRKSKLALSNQQRALAMNRGNVAANSPMQSDDDLFGSDEQVFGVGGGGGLGGGGGFGAVYNNRPNSVENTDGVLNRLACEIQILDLVSGSKVNKKPGTIASPSTEGMSIVYRLANKTSLPSRSDKQLIQIAAMPLEADFYRLASPVLTSYVYQEAKLTNTTEFVLLAGPSATFLGDRFVGRGNVPTVAIGESFTVGLGIDESLRASRELVEKSDRIQGGNRIAQFDYKLSVENFGSEAVTVRVMDRLPQSDGKAIKVSLVESDPSTAEVNNSEDGLLRWDLEVPVSAIGDKSEAVTYTMTIEHDKNLTIVGGVK